MLQVFEIQKNLTTYLTEILKDSSYDLDSNIEEIKNKIESFLTSNKDDTNYDVEIAFRQVLSSFFPILPSKSLVSKSSGEESSASNSATSSSTPSSPISDDYDENSVTLIKNYDTKFYGEILLFLSNNHTISDKSSVNLGGRFNTNNITYYEDLESFKSINQDKKLMVKIKNKVSSSSSASNINKKDEKKNKEVEEGEEGEEEEGEEEEDNQLKNQEQNEKMLKFVEISYDLYESFWKFQNLLSQNSQNLQTQASDLIQESNWNAMINNISSVLKLLSDTTSTVSHSSSTSNNSEYFGSKYLTSSQLFPIQLLDPILRLQICIQILILIHYIKLKIFPALPNDFPNRLTYENNLLKLHDDCYQIILNSPSEYSNKLPSILSSIFIRENKWNIWKAGGCKPFENDFDISKKGKNQEDNDEQVLKKIKLSTNAIENDNSISNNLSNLFLKSSDEQSLDQDSILNIMSKLKKHSNMNKSLYYNNITFNKEYEEINPVDDYKEIESIYKKKGDDFFDCSHENVSETLSYLACEENYQYDVDTYLETPLDDEFHPKNDTKFIWKLRRSLMNNNIEIFDSMIDGNLLRGLRKLRNIPHIEEEIKENSDENDDKMEAESLTPNIETEENNQDSPANIEEDIVQTEQITDTTEQVYEEITETTEKTEETMGEQESVPENEESTPGQEGEEVSPEQRGETMSEQVEGVLDQEVVTESKKENEGEVMTEDN